MKKSVVIIAIVLLALGFSLFAGAWIASGFDFYKLSTVAYETNTYTIDEVFEKIAIDVRETDITFRAASDGICRVVCEEKAKEKHSVFVEDGILRIRTEDSRHWFDYLTLFSKSPSMTVYLPSDYYANLTLKSSTGNISIPDAFTFGSVKAELSTGDVEYDASVNNSLEIETSTGDIRLNGVRAGTLALSASTGDIILKDTLASGELRIKTSTGDVKLENCDAQSIAVKTSTGDVTGTLCSAKRFFTETSTGHVLVPDSKTGGKCEIKTSTGDIRITVSDAD